MSGDIVRLYSIYNTASLYTIPASPRYNTRLNNFESTSNNLEHYDKTETSGKLVNINLYSLRSGFEPTILSGFIWFHLILARINSMIYHLEGGATSIPLAHSVLGMILY